MTRDLCSQNFSVPISCKYAHLEKGLKIGKNRESFHILPYQKIFFHKNYYHFEESVSVTLFRTMRERTENSEFEKQH
jgi:hypothetical protein